MILLAYFTTISLCFLTFIENTSVRYYRPIILFFVIVWLILLSGFRDGSTMPDYATYQGYFLQISTGSFNYLIEYSFVILAKMALFIEDQSAIGLFVIYAIIGVCIKYLAISKFMGRELILYSIVVYSTNYFILHEMIQIRVGVATGFLYLSIYYLIHGNKIKYVMYIIFATLFHYSSIIFIILGFLRFSNISCLKTTIILFFSYTINFAILELDLILRLVELLPASSIKGKLYAYVVVSQSEYVINVFGLFILTRIIILYFFVFNYKLIEKFNSNIKLFINLYFMGVLSYVVFAAAPVISVRISQLFFFAEVFMIPYLVVVLRGTWLPKLVFFSYCLLALFMNVKFTSYFKWHD